ncbi:hypothetical protein BLNAU_20661 [Blattamonas nauphoetae]|uniref:Uncharacterized protein n=1 Tax=Blattamonas nauphoetae TaxID=2049346 RepID=A0ABQ9WY11_9EUKA|nr:hypothetical protein BLNAU_20661 [Blattamonas nauphoetae]
MSTTALISLVVPLLSTTILPNYRIIKSILHYFVWNFTTALFTTHGIADVKSLHSSSIALKNGFLNCSKRQHNIKLHEPNHLVSIEDTTHCVNTSSVVFLALFCGASFWTLIASYKVTKHRRKSDAVGPSTLPSSSSSIGGARNQIRSLSSTTLNSPKYATLNSSQSLFSVFCAVSVDWLVGFSPCFSNAVAASSPIHSLVLIPLRVRIFPSLEQTRAKVVVCLLPTYINSTTIDRELVDLITALPTPGGFVVAWEIKKLSLTPIVPQCLPLCPAQRQTCLRNTCLSQSTRCSQTGMFGMPILQQQLKTCLQRQLLLRIVLWLLKKVNEELLTNWYLLDSKKGASVIKRSVVCEGRL